MTSDSLIDDRYSNKEIIYNSLLEEDSENCYIEVPTIE